MDKLEILMATVVGGVSVNDKVIIEPIRYKSVSQYFKISPICTKTYFRCHISLNIESYGINHPINIIR